MIQHDDPSSGKYSCPSNHMITMPKALYEGILSWDSPVGFTMKRLFYHHHLVLSLLSPALIVLVAHPPWPRPPLW